MAFNLTTLQADARYFAMGNSSATQYGATDLNRNINRWYNEVVAEILKANGDWQINGEIATTNIVAGQREYILPTDILKLNEVYIKTAVSSEYEKAKQIDAFNKPQELDQATYGYYPEIPEFDINDNSLFIYTNETTIGNSTAGLKIHYQVDITELSGSTDAPNIAEPFKRLISLGAAFDYCVANSMDSKANSLKVLIDEKKKDVLEFYANRSTVKGLRIVPKQTNYC